MCTHMPLGFRDRKEERGDEAGKINKDDTKEDFERQVQEFPFHSARDACAGGRTEPREERKPLVSGGPWYLLFSLSGMEGQGKGLETPWWVSNPPPPRPGLSL